MISRVIGFFKEDVFAFLTPWLENARNFMNFVINNNDTKLLDYDALGFFVRTRDENCYYFRCKCSLTGQVTIELEQSFDENGNAVNRFVHGFICGNDYITKKHQIFSKRILTKKDIVDAMTEITKDDRFSWFVQIIAETFLLIRCNRYFDDDLQHENIEFVETVEHAIMKELEIEDKKSYDLTDEECRKISERLEELTSEDAAALYLENKSRSDRV
jgi:hypothetical protein